MQKGKQRSTKHTQKTKDRVKQIPLNHLAEFNLAISLLLLNEAKISTPLNMHVRPVIRLTDRLYPIVKKLGPHSIPAYLTFLWRELK